MEFCAVQEKYRKIRINKKIKYKKKIKLKNFNFVISRSYVQIFPFYKEHMSRKLMAVKNDDTNAGNITTSLSKRRELSELSNLHIRYGENADKVYNSVSAYQHSNLSNSSQHLNENNCELLDDQVRTNNHIKKQSHDGVKEKLECSICKMKLKSLKSLIKHLSSKHDCIQRNKQLHENAKTENTNMQLECSECGESFKRLQHYNRHILNHKKHSCSLCNCKFSSKKLLSHHQLHSHNIKILDKKHECSTCGKSFSRKSYLLSHLQTHTGEKPSKCVDCNKNFKSNYQLLQHTKTEKHLQKSKNVSIQVKKPFLCSTCGTLFTTRYTLQRHIDVLHSSSEGYKCEHCDFITKSKTNLKRHFDVHMNIKMFVCEICGLSFRSQCNLQDHQSYVHTENRNFLCDVCEKSLKTKSSLQRHMLIHNEDRPHKCHCGKTYKRLSHLKRHMASSHPIDEIETQKQELAVSNLMYLFSNFTNEPIETSNGLNNVELVDESASPLISTTNEKEQISSDDIHLFLTNSDISPSSVIPNESVAENYNDNENLNTLSLDIPNLSLSPNKFGFDYPSSPLNSISIEDLNQNLSSELLSTSCIPNLVDPVPGVGNENYASVTFDPLSPNKESYVLNEESGLSETLWNSTTKQFLELVDMLNLPSLDNAEQLFNGATDLWGKDVERNFTTD